MSNKLRLEIISDVVCPWCVIGYHNLLAATKELNISDDISISWLPFELNPDMPAEGENLREHVYRKYGSTPEQSARSRVNIAKAGAEHGFTFNYFDEMKIVNTLEAHVLLDYAKIYNKQTELKMQLFAAFFSQQQDVSNREVLKNALIAVGLDEIEGMSLLDKAELKTEVRMQEALWQQNGVHAVPTVVINREVAVTGAHSAQSYKEILTEIIKSLNE